ncbi:metallophosphoesterase family protein [uncultured Mitsuokella sp.]|uniref:metallophosphoesterase family protein n=1 Tax=uncultured Mitsuokella sp. TaxID=453120 RepID=UPI0025F647C6|nr:metallophosphoesterase family protein [uncultured Mitsuokella sp.]
MNILEEINAKRQQLKGKEKIYAKDGMVIVPDSHDFGRILAVGDIHGNFERLQSLFQHVPYAPQEDLLIFLGDYIDRGPETAKVLQMVMKLKRKYPHVITLTGNHEAMMRHYFQNHSIREPMDLEHGWLRSGGQATFTSLKETYEKDCGLYHELLEFVLSLDHIATVGEQYLFTHAGFYPKLSYEEQVDDMLWIRTEFYEEYDGAQTVVVGHTPVQCFDRDRHHPLMFRNHIIDCDTGSYLPGGHISCLNVRKMSCWQSDDDDMFRD